jgi:ribose 5-phosphate isomerase B
VAAASARWYAKKVKGVRAGLIHDHFSSKQGVEDDHMNILCMGGRTVGPEVAWDLVRTFLAAQCSQAPRHLCRLGKVASLESGKQQHKREGLFHVRRQTHSTGRQHHPHPFD